MLLGNLFNNFFTLVGTVGAPRVAAMMLRNIIKSRQDNGDIAPGAPTIIDDIQRLTTVIWSDNGVWKTSPLDAAFKNDLITPDEYREIEGEIVFFMVSSAIQKANLVAGTMGHALEMYSGQLVSLSAMAYRDSLPTSKTVTDTPTPEALTAQLFSRYCRLFMLTGSSSSSANIFPLYRLRWRMLIPLFTTFRRLLTQALK